MGEPIPPLEGLAARTLVPAMKPTHRTTPLVPRDARRARLTVVHGRVSPTVGTTADRVAGTPECLKGTRRVTGKPSRRRKKTTHDDSPPFACTVTSGRMPLTASAGASHPAWLLATPLFMEPVDTERDAD